MGISKPGTVRTARASSFKQRAKITLIPRLCFGCCWLFVYLRDVVYCGIKNI